MKTLFFVVLITISTSLLSCGSISISKYFEDVKVYSENAAPTPNSFDSGVMKTPASSVQMRCVIDQNVQFGLQEVGTLAKSTDGGTTWTVVANLTDTPIGRMIADDEVRQLYFITEERGWICGTDGTYGTDDGGLSCFPAAPARPRRARKRRASGCRGT